GPRRRHGAARGRSAGAPRPGRGQGLGGRSPAGRRARGPVVRRAGRPRGPLPLSGRVLRCDAAPSCSPPPPRACPGTLEEGWSMPNKSTVERAREDLREGKSPTTAAGEFVHEEMEHIRRGKHGARSPKQAIAIGLSKARRAGVPLKPPKRGQAKERTRRSAERAYEVGQGKRKPRAPSRRRGRAVSRALKRESRSAASRGALSRQAKSAASRRRTRSRTGRKSRSRASRKR